MEHQSQAGISVWSVQISLVETCGLCGTSQGEPVPTQKQGHLPVERLEYLCKKEAIHFDLSGYAFALWVYLA